MVCCVFLLFRGSCILLCGMLIYMLLFGVCAFRVIVGYVFEFCDVFVRRVRAFLVVYDLLVLYVVCCIYIYVFLKNLGPRCLYGFGLGVLFLWPVCSSRAFLFLLLFREICVCLWSVGFV